MSDPTPPPFTPPVFASRVTGRDPEFKPHRTLAQARMAVALPGSWDSVLQCRTVRGGDVWEWDTSRSRWFLLHQVASGTPRTDLPWN